MLSTVRTVPAVSYWTGVRSRALAATVYGLLAGLIAGLAWRKASAALLMGGAMFLPTLLLPPKPSAEDDSAGR